MKFILTIVLIFVCFQFAAAKNFSEKAFKLKKDGRLLSLFSIVTFRNTGCKSQSSLSIGQSAYRNGTCFTYSECLNKGGAVSGNCASGFGVCCVFLISTTGSTVSQNCSYLRNPGFPSAYTSTSSISYAINKVTADVCWLRLDFESFTLLGPTVSTETQGGLCPDTFKVTTNTGQVIPTICGLNTGQHIYVDMGAVTTDSSTIAFAFTGSSTTRIWEIKVSQIECTNGNRPPDGCLQYWTTSTGRITTFNFLATTSSSHLANQV